MWMHQNCIKIIGAKERLLNASQRNNGRFGGGVKPPPTTIYLLLHLLFLRLCCSAVRCNKILYISTYSSNKYSRRNINEPEKQKCKSKLERMGPTENATQALFAHSFIHLCVSQLILSQFYQYQTKQRVNWMSSRQFIFEYIWIFIYRFECFWSPCMWCEAHFVCIYIYIYELQWAMNARV